MRKKGEKNRKRPRRVGIYEEIEHRYYIFCEGTETEPKYFAGFKKSIESNPIYKNAVYLYYEGTGRETVNVVKEAEKYVIRNALTFGDVWCIYDKDDFPADQFDSASKYIEELNKSNKTITYHAGWSNESIEYWFILHFSYYTSNNTRKEFIDYLNQMFEKRLKKSYTKNSSDIWDDLLTIGDPKNAIKFAEKQMKKFSGCKDSVCAPSTKIYLLVKELAKYLPENKQNRFL